MRMQRVEHGDVTFINDAYNANPESMRSALLTIAEIKSAARKGAVLGDMLELGDRAFREHLEIGRLAAKAGLDYVILVGEMRDAIKKGLDEMGYRGDTALLDTAVEARERLLATMRPGDVVLVKASRALQLEKVIEDG